MNADQPAPGAVQDWPRVAAELADLDDHLHHLAVHHLAGDLDVRRARRLARQALRDARDGLGVCESCRAAPAETRVTFTDHIVFAVCAACAAGAIAEGSGGEAA